MSLEAELADLARVNSIWLLDHDESAIQASLPSPAARAVFDASPSLKRAVRALTNMPTPASSMRIAVTNGKRHSSATIINDDSVTMPQSC